MILDVRGGRFWFGVIPGGVFIFLGVHQHVIVVRRSFPRADGSVIAGLEEFAVDAFGWEIVVSFHLLGVIAFGEKGVLPGCFCHKFQMRAKLPG